MFTSLKRDVILTELKKSCAIFFALNFDVPNIRSGTEKLTAEKDLQTRGTETRSGTDAPCLSIASRRTLRRATRKSFEPLTIFTPNSRSILGYAHLVNLFE